MRLIADISGRATAELGVIKTISQRLDILAMVSVCSNLFGTMMQKAIEFVMLKSLGRC